MTNTTIRQPLSLQVDMVFKAVFGRDTRESKLILMDLLNTILNRSDHNAITSVTHKNPINMKSNIDDKETILDVKVETSDGELIDIEMQVAFEPQFHKRSLYYWSKLHSSQLKSGQQYDQLKKSICINIMSTTCFKDITTPHISFYAYSPAIQQKLCEDLEIHYVQLPLINDTIEVDIMDRFTEWMTFIKDVHDQKKKNLINRLLTKEGVFKMAYDEYSKINDDELMRERLEARQKFIWDMNTARSNAMKEGKAEALHQVALNMLSKSMDPSTISELTGLSLEEISNLQ